MRLTAGKQPPLHEAFASLRPLLAKSPCIANWRLNGQKVELGISNNVRWYRLNSL
jgi:hypothetical protein